MKILSPKATNANQLSSKVLAKLWYRERLIVYFTFPIYINFRFTFFTERRIWPRQDGINSSCKSLKWFSFTIKPPKKILIVCVSFYFFVKTRMTVVYHDCFNSLTGKFYSIICSVKSWLWSELVRPQLCS